MNSLNPETAAKIAARPVRLKVVTALVDYLMGEHSTDSRTAACQRIRKIIGGTHTQAAEIFDSYIRSPAEIGRKGGQAKSERKTASSRANGLAPCRPGKHRGRPKKTT